MPSLGAISLAVCSDAIPPHPPDGYAILEQPGMADQSALFYPDRWQPVTLRAVVTAANYSAAAAKIASLRALRRTTQTVDDGVSSVASCLVMAVRASTPEVAFIVGGNDPGDTYEVELEITVWPPTPEV